MRAEPPPRQTESTATRHRPGQAVAMYTPRLRRILLAAALVPALTTAFAQAPTPTGETQGNAVVHTPASLAGVVSGAAVVLPARATGGPVFAGLWRDAPRVARDRVPVVVFLHGSSGLALPAIGEWQRWLASLGIASVAPDSFALPNRMTYKSPIPREVYEQIHALRMSEIAPVVEALRGTAWADSTRLVLAGTSEGATSVARWTGNEFSGRLIYAWSCEDNYFVQSHRTALPASQPVLNMISTSDPFFSPTNTWLGNPKAKGHCGDALRDHKQSAVVLIPGAPHTLLNLPAARHATEGFLRDLLKQ
jgi:dienelactone hydrolase